jgi:hypothetical protein
MLSFKCTVAENGEIMVKGGVYTELDLQKIDNAWSENHQVVAECLIYSSSKFDIHISIAALPKIKTGFICAYYGVITFSFGDIKRKWLKIREQLLSGEFPEEWKRQLNIEELLKKQEDIEKEYADIGQEIEDIKQEERDIDMRTEDIKKKEGDIEMSEQELEQVQEDSELETEDIEKQYADIVQEEEDSKMSEQDMELNSEDIEKKEEDMNMSEQELEQVEREIDMSEQDMELNSEDIEQEEEDMNMRTENIEKKEEDMNMRTENMEQEIEEIELEDEELEQEIEDIEQEDEDIEQEDEGIELEDEDSELEDEDSELETEEVKVVKGLSQISETDKVVELTRCCEYSIRMMCITNKTTMQNEGCKIYLVNTITKTRYIGAENEIRIAKETILNARGYEIMYPIKRFNIEISEDQLKQAFDRAKEFLEKSKKPLFDDTTVTIGEAYVRVVEYALQCAKAEADCKDIIQEKRKFIYNKKEKTIMIYTGIFNDILRDLDLNYTQKIFNRKLKMLETDMGVQLIYTNRSEGKGYGWNTTGNIRYYKYALNEELIGR